MDKIKLLLIESLLEELLNSDIDGDQYHTITEILTILDSVIGNN